MIFVQNIILLFSYNTIVNITLKESAQIGIIFILLWILCLFLFDYISISIKPKLIHNTFSIPIQTDYFYPYFL